MSDLMLEVDDELRSQQLKAFWTKYGQWIIGVITVTILATAIGTFWHNHLNTKLANKTDQVMAVLTDQPLSATDQYKAMTDQSRDTPNAALGSLMELQKAQLSEQSKNLDQAAKEYESVMTASGTSHTVQDLARLNRVRVGLLRKEPSADLLKTLEPLLNDKSAFRYSAKEFQALILQSENKHDEANKILEVLSNDAGAPASLRDRAKLLMKL